jgi:hypothetical protein
MSFRQMIVMVKGPKGKRGWLIAADEEDPLRATAYFIEEDPAQGDNTLRTYLGMAPGTKLPTQIEVQVNDTYFRRLAGQVFWR